MERISKTAGSWVPEGLDFPEMSSMPNGGRGFAKMIKKTLAILILAPLAMPVLFLIGIGLVCAAADWAWTQIEPKEIDL